MKNEIVLWVKRAAQHYKLEAYYLPDNDAYIMTFRGRAVMNFTSKMFYQIPKNVRFKQIMLMMKLGLNHNFGEKYRNQLFLPRKIGIKIWQKNLNKDQKTTS